MRFLFLSVDDVWPLLTIAGALTLLSRQAVCPARASHDTALVGGGWHDDAWMPFLNRCKSDVEQRGSCRREALIDVPDLGKFLDAIAWWLF